MTCVIYALVQTDCNFYGKATGWQGPQRPSWLCIRGHWTAHGPSWVGKDEGKDVSPQPVDTLTIEVVEIKVVLYVYICTFMHLTRRQLKLGCGCRSHEATMPVPSR